MFARYFLTLCLRALTGAGLLVGLVAFSARASEEPPPGRSSRSAGVQAAQAPADGEPTGIVTPAPAALAPAISANRTLPGLRLRQLPLEHRNDPSLALGEIVPGAALNGDRLRLRGGSGANVATLVDGFRVFRLRPPTAFVGQVEVWSANHGVALADLPEGAVVMTGHAAQSGWRLEVDASTETKQRVILLPSIPVFPDVLFIERKPPESSQVVTAAGAGSSFGGRLFLSAAGSFVATGQELPDEPGTPVQPTPNRDLSRHQGQGAFSAAWRVSPQHRIEALALLALTRQSNGDSELVTAGAQPARDDRGGMIGLRWTGGLTDWLTARVQASAEAGRSRRESMLCRNDPAACEAVSPTRTGQNREGNVERLEHVRESHLDLTGSLEADAGTAERIQHRLRLVSRLTSSALTRELTVPGDLLTIKHEQPGGFPAGSTRVRSFTNDPRIAPEMHGWSTYAGQSLSWLSTIEDELQIVRRLVVRPGLGVLSARTSGVDDGVILANAALVWHVGVRVDLTSDRLTVARASTSRRADPSLDGLGAWLPDAQLSESCAVGTGGAGQIGRCRFGGGPAGRTVGLPCGPSGIDASGARCTAAPQMPRVTEHTFGLWRALTDATWVDLELIYRRTTGLPRVLETNQLLDFRDALEPQPTGKGRNGRDEQLANLTTPEEIFRRYLGATLSLGGHIGDLAALVAYTYGRQRAGGFEDLQGGVGTRFFEYDAREQRHSVRALGTYQLGRIAALGLVYAYDANPAVLADLVPLGGANTFWRRPIVRGGDRNDPENVRFTSGSSLQRLNLQGRLRLGALLPIDADFYADVMNALDAKSPYPEIQGRWVRFGIELHQ